jgi:dTDP-glucose 4,6-dehydratase
LRVLISGGAGFIASHLTDRLLKDGHEVVAADSFLTGREENIEHLRSNPRYQFIHQDVSVPFTVDGRLDYVYHMASPASPFDYLALPIETLMVGSAGTKNLLDIALCHQARYLLASTSECYGDPLEHPQKETYWGHVNPVGPRSVYDEAKRFAEALTMAYHRTYGLRTHIVRIFNTYGPRMKLNDGRVVPAFLDQALNGKPITIFGDGSQTRSFCYVLDLVEGLLRLIESDEAYPVNLGNPNEITILEFAKRIQRLVGSDCPIEFHALPKDDPKQRQPDITKARKLLHWEPQVPLEDGLRLTIEYFRARELAPAAD